MKEKLTNSILKTLLKLFRALVNRWNSSPTSADVPDASGDQWRKDRTALALIAVDILVSLTRILLDRAESGMSDISNNTPNSF